jgi:CubicO group peptidase (beta-lactamase class C family)
MTKSMITLLTVGVAALALQSPALAQEARPIAPAAVPSPNPFAALDRSYHALVDAGKLAGIVTLVAHHGRIRHVAAYGVQDVDTKVPVRADTIWRIASMTKPITGVAMMILYEQGKWKLDDPVAKFIPEFRDLKVRAPDGKLVAQEHPMTMRELMSHTAGFDASTGYERAKMG